MPFSNIKDVLSGIILPIILGLISGLVRWLRFGKRSIWLLISSTLTASFVAVLVHWGLDYFIDLSQTVKAAIIGFASYMGGSLLDAVQFRVINGVKEGHKKHDKHR